MQPKRIAQQPFRFAVIAVIGAVLAFGLAKFVAPVGELEVRLADRLRIALAPPTPAQDPRISMIALDEATMAGLPYRSPVDRGLLAEIVRLLDAAGARAIGLDVLLDQPTEAEKDARLAEALADFDGLKVLAWADERAGMTPAQSAWLATFLQSAEALPGFVNLRQDPDGVVRTHFNRLSGTEVQGFASLLAADTAGGEAIWQVDWRLPQANGAPVFQQTPAHVLPLMAANPQILETWYKDRIVIIGADLPQQDRHATPLSMVMGDPPTTGMQIHAHLVAQLLDKRTVPTLGVGLSLGYLLALSLIACLLAVLGWPLVVRALAGVALSAAHLACVYLVFGASSLVLPVVPGIVAIVLSAAGATALDAVLAHRSKRFIRQAFAHYLAPQLVERLVNNPDELRLGGERRVMTFLFTDIAGFTSMSERMDAEDLATLLNTYLEGVSNIVMRHDGVVDKYIGDAVVALFGVPNPDPAHAAMALLCAAEIDDFAEEFRRDNAATGLGVTRIGLHTGEAVVGNFGGNARFDYTAIGDAMNIAARLEAANKTFGTRLSFSAPCRDAALPHLEQDLAIHPVGDVVLKGKSEPITVLALRSDLSPEQHSAWQGAYDALRDGDTSAQERLSALVDDPLARFHLDRLARGEHGTLFELTEK